MEKFEEFLASASNATGKQRLTLANDYRKDE